MSTILEYRKDGPIEILPDGTIVRHSEILPDSTTLRVNLDFMDKLDDVQRSVALSSQVRDRISNTALHDGMGNPAGHKPGYVFAGPPLGRPPDAAARQRLDDAYAAYEKTLTEAWRPQPVHCPTDQQPQGPSGDVSPVDALEQAYCDHEAFLRDAWRSR